MGENVHKLLQLQVEENPPRGHKNKSKMLMHYNMLTLTRFYICDRLFKWKFSRSYRRHSRL